MRLSGILVEVHYALLRQIVGIDRASINAGRRRRDVDCIAMMQAEPVECGDRFIKADRGCAVLMVGRLRHLCLFERPGRLRDMIEMFVGYRHGDADPGRIAEIVAIRPFRALPRTVGKSQAGDP